MSTKYEVDPNDPTLKAVEDERANELYQNSHDIDEQIYQSDKDYDSQIKGYEDIKITLEKNQNEATDLAIQKLENAQEQAHKDYMKEQTAAYTDYKKQSNPYGYEAERIAASGLSGTGYSESSKVRQFTAYQNRVAVARQTYKQAETDFKIAIQEAKVQNNAALAQIALETYEKTSALIIQKLSAKQGLLSDKAKNELQINTRYDTKWQNEYENLFNEKKLEEDARQYDATLAFQKAQLAEQKRQFDLQYGDNSGGSSGGSKLSDRSLTSQVAKANTNAQAKAAKDKAEQAEKTAKETTARKEKAYADAAKRSFANHEQVNRFLRDHGITTDMKCLDRSTWKKNKKTYGDTHSEFKYKSYYDYLKAYVQAAIKYS
jgi:hypothetical protein